MFRDAVSLREALNALADGSEEPEPAAARKVAFVYTGEGSQWAGMGRALYEDEPVVRAVLDRCDAVVRKDRGTSLLDVMFGRAAGDLDDPAWTQPAIYALECALTALWSSLGVNPSVVAGHDLGELAAAQAAGVFGLEDGLCLACAGAVPASLREDGAAEPPSDDLGAALADVALAPPALVLVSGLTGRAVELGGTLDGPYWRRQAHEPTAFAECVGTLAALDVEVVVEVGPHAVLGPAVAGAWPDSADARRAPIVLSSLQQEVSGSTADSGFVAAVAKAYESGIDVSFTGLFAGETRRRISLPSYPFQRRRHWIKESSRAPR